MTRNEPYDIIIAGGGLAGLSLACHMVRTPLRDQSILIVDRDPKKSNDRTWGFWADRPTLFDEVIWRAWDRMCVAGEGDAAARTLALGDYQYKMIRGIDFYDFARRDLAARPNVTWLQGRIGSFEDGKVAATVTVDGEAYRGRWVFNSLPARPNADDFQVLKMHFRGWEIETPSDRFDPATITFMDFRTPQAGEMRFFYVLPFAADRALVEYTVFSKAVLRRADYEAAIRDYLSRVLGIDDYVVVAQEAGAVPITDDPLERQLGKRVMAIGARAGRIKPSTGYAFMRVQQDSEEILDSLLLHGHPFDVPDDPDIYDLMDAVLLKVIHQDGGKLEGAFDAMFRRNTIEQILRFLDESSSPWENLMMIATMPSQVFIKAFFQVAATENLLDIMKG